MVGAERKDPAVGEDDASAVLVDSMLPRRNGLHRAVPALLARRTAREHETGDRGALRGDFRLQSAVLLLLVTRRIRAAATHGEHPEPEEHQRDDAAGAANPPRNVLKHQPRAPEADEHKARSRGRKRHPEKDVRESRAERIHHGYLTLTEKPGAETAPPAE